MYKVTASTKKDFVVKSDTLDFSYIMDKDKFLGTTPVGQVLVALSGCVLMCVRGYYLKKGIKELLITADLEYETEFLVNVKVDKEVLEEEKPLIIEYVKKYCTVSQMLNKEVKIIITGK